MNLANIAHDLQQFSQGRFILFRVNFSTLV